MRFESVMRLRDKLEELGKMKGVNQDEKGEHHLHEMGWQQNMYTFIQIQKNF